MRKKRVTPHQENGESKSGLRKIKVFTENREKEVCLGEQTAKKMWGDSLGEKGVHSKVTRKH